MWFGFACALHNEAVWQTGRMLPPASSFHGLGYRVRGYRGKFAAVLWQHPTKFTNNKQGIFVALAIRRGDAGEDAAAKPPKPGGLPVGTR